MHRRLLRRRNRSCGLTGSTPRGSLIGCTTTKLPGGTEYGVYKLNGKFSGIGIVRNANAKFWIPSESEWYKATYFAASNDPSKYWMYPTQSDAVPEKSLADAAGIGLWRVLVTLPTMGKVLMWLLMFVQMAARVLMGRLTWAAMRRSGTTQNGEFRRVGWGLSTSVEFAVATSSTPLHI